MKSAGADFDDFPLTCRPCQPLHPLLSVRVPHPPGAEFGEIWESPKGGSNEIRSAAQVEFWTHRVGVELVMCLCASASL